MSRNLGGVLVFLFFLPLLNTCIDPYTPSLAKYKSALVVEGLVTDENAPYEVILSRTFQSTDSVIPKVTDAVVYISDEEGNMTNLSNSGNGIYKTDSTQFIGVPGKTYNLHIQTSDGNKYESEPCQMTPVAGIDSIYFAREEQINSTQGKTLTGIEIYLNTDEESAGSGYFRWTYDETWKFSLPSPKLYNYIDSTDIVPLTNVKEFCWKSNESGEILVGSILPGQPHALEKEPVLFIQSDLSDRLTVRYSLIVKQLSVSQKEFDFWNNLQQVNESGGSIFDTQPYSVISNIYNVDNPGETVLGYFSVSAVQQKRIYINPVNLNGMNLPQYQYDCTEFIVSPDDYNVNLVPGEPRWTWHRVYNLFMSAGGMTFVEPIYDANGDLYKLVFVKNECSDCSLSGSANKPDFWTDNP
ncbi:MAG: DUF4249 domain-containing protein [Bacteroidales bacterium]|jgi:hypothetical protein